MANSRQDNLVVNLNDSMLYCPIAGNGNVMRHPVQASDGYFYELGMLLSLFKNGDFISPVTRQPISWVAHQKFLEASFDDSDIPNREPVYLSREEFLLESKKLNDLLAADPINKTQINGNQRRPVSIEASPMVLGFATGSCAFVALLTAATIVFDDALDARGANAVLALSFLSGLFASGIKHAIGNQSVSLTDSRSGFFRGYNAVLDAIDDDLVIPLGPHSSPF